MSKINLYYVTDPLCSFCWAFEPTLRKFRYEYANYIDHDLTVMGGMIENWETYNGDGANGIQTAVDVAEHWRKVGDFTRMPIDGRVWLDEPIASSYPSSKVYQIIRRDFPDKADLFLRKLRERVMLHNQDISKSSVLAILLEDLGFDSRPVLSAAESFEGRSLLSSDLSLASALSATGFPTVVLVNEANQGVKIVGAQPYEGLVAALKQILRVETLKPMPVPSLDIVMKTTPLLMSREIEVLYNLSETEVEGFVHLTMGQDNVETGQILGQSYYKAV